MKIFSYNISRSFFNQSVSRNIFFLGITQIVNYLFPLLTLPFLVKTLGNFEWGKIAFAQALIAYFILIVDYGFNISATRKIAVALNDKKALRHVFYNTIYSKVILLLISGVFLLIFTIGVPKFSKDALLYWFFFGSVIGNLFYPQWFFQGIEKMQYITIINFVIKLIFTGLIFLLVDDKTDSLLVGFLSGISYIVPGVIAFFIAKKIVGNPLRVRLTDIKIEMIEGFHLFVSSAMTSILTSASVFILGLMSSEEIVGGYSAIDRLIKACIMVFIPITTGIYPTISKQLGVSEEEGIRKIVKLAIPTIVLSIVLVLLLLFLKDIIIENFYTKYFLKYSTVYVLLLFWIPVSILNNFIGIQYLTGSGRGNFYAKSFLIAGICTLFFMLLLTKLYSYTGTALSVLLGEIILTLVMLFMIVFKVKSK